MHSDEEAAGEEALGKEKPPRLTEIRGDNKAKAQTGAKAKAQTGAKAKIEETRPEGEARAKGDKTIRATEVALQPKEEAANVIRAIRRDILLENVLHE